MRQTWSGSNQISSNLRDLAQCLDDVACGLRPTRGELTVAPLIDGWEPKLTSSHRPAIRGRVYGHPLLADGETIRCAILAADPDLNWVMTWAGFYRLGAEMPVATSSEGARA